MAITPWRQYETQIFNNFRRKYPNLEIVFDQKIEGRHSKIKRQADVVVRGNIADVPMVGVFDCKLFSETIDVGAVDAMFGYMDDVGVRFGGLVSATGFSDAARNRAAGAGIDLRTVQFIDPDSVVDSFVPRLDFSDRRNSMYLPLIG